MASLEWDQLPITWSDLPTNPNTNKESYIRNLTLYRARAPGGWLITVMPWGLGSSDVPSVTFVPDPNHEWK